MRALTVFFFFFPQGVVAVKFAEPQAAEKCIAVMDGRWFAKKQIKAIWYDGITDYTVKESSAEQEKRLEDFGRWLEDQSSSSDESDDETAGKDAGTQEEEEEEEEKGAGSKEEGKK
jgi:HIV Tat-specific factor 1